MAAGSVYLEDGHVGGGADDEEDEEDSAYWDVNGDGGDEAEGCGSGRVGW